MRLPLVYIIQNTQGHLKIGYSGSFTKRTAKIAPASPYPCELAATYCHPQARKIEPIIHQILNDVKMNGEWFDCSIQRVLLAIPMACLILKRRTAKKASAIVPKTEVGQRLRTLRQACSFDKIRDFAKAIGIAENRLSMYELGERSIPYDILYSVILETNATADWILFGDERHLTVSLRDQIESTRSVVLNFPQKAA